MSGVQESLTGPVSVGVVGVESAAGDPLGHCHVVSRDGGGQVERWLLYEDPLNDFRLVPSREMASMTLEEWTRAATTPRSQGGWWEAGAYYIKASADVYFHGEDKASHDWRTIPYPPPDPSGVSVASTLDPDQVDPGGGKVSQLLDDGSLFEGHVFSTASVEAPQSIEYWYLPQGFVEAGSFRAVTKIVPEV
ncbi:MAG: hypothetical protein R3B70_47925, partial [Polyangiaceae bacterium]